MMFEDDEYMTAANTSVGGLQTALGAGFSPAAAAEQLQRLQAQYMQGQSGMAAGRQQSMQSMRDRFEQARNEIRSQRFGAPDLSERLFGISQALLSPRRMPGFAGTLDNLMPTLGRMATAQREGRDARAEAIAKSKAEEAALLERYGIDAMEADQKRAIDLMKVYGPLAKGQNPQTTYDPFTGSVIDKNAGTATPVRQVAPPPPPEAVNAGLQRLAAQMKNSAVPEEVKRQSVLNFGRTFQMNAVEVMRMLGMN
jgi:hypothetical protein